MRWLLSKTLHTGTNIYMCLPAWIRLSRPYRHTRSKLARWWHEHQCQFLFNTVLSDGSSKVLWLHFCHCGWSQFQLLTLVVSLCNQYLAIGDKDFSVFMQVQGKHEWPFLWEITQPLHQAPSLRNIHARIVRTIILLIGIHITRPAFQVECTEENGQRCSGRCPHWKQQVRPAPAYRPRGQTRSIQVSKHHGFT